MPWFAGNWKGKAEAAVPVGTPAPQANLSYLSLFTLGMALILSVILTLPSALPGRVQLAPGQPATQDYYAPQHLRYDSEVLTAADREAARLAVGPVYDTNTAVITAGSRRLNDLLVSIETARATDAPPNPGRGSSLLRQLAEAGLSEADIVAVTQASPDRWSRLRAEALRLFDSLMVNGKIADTAQLEHQRSALPLGISYELSAAERHVTIALLAPVLAVNLTANADATEERRKAAADVVPAHSVEVQQDEIILRVGQIADAAAIEKLERAGLRNPTPSVANTGAVFGSVAILCLLLHFYLLRLQPQFTLYRRPLLLLGLVLIVPTVVMRLIVPGHSIWPYMMPLAACSMLVAVLLDANLAIVVTFVLGVVAALLTQGSFELPFYYCISGITAVYAIWRAERVSTFVLSGVYIALASFAAAVLLRLVENQHLDLKAIGILAAAAGINGALSASLTFATFSVLGSLFGIATVLQLLELAHPTQPLLRRLMREAPGTYHHSLVVSNLAEHAAQLVGADPLLARVAAYYHDIGKVLNPQAFIENQSGLSNLHDTLDPVTSARLIREHITEGRLLAQRARLPRRVVDCIPQHHGTTVVKYFYHKALQDDPTTNIEDFRCPGPKPQSKEAAILMLADSTEATVRAVAQAGTLEPSATLDPDGEPPPNSIVGIIRRTVKERLEDGQLDECDLTIRDLTRIQAAFATMLNGIYHPRISYPDKPSAAPQAAPVSAVTELTAVSIGIPFERIRRPFGAAPRSPALPPATVGQPGGPTIITLSSPSDRLAQTDLGTEREVVYDQPQQSSRRGG